MRFEEGANPTTPDASLPPAFRSPVSSSPVIRIHSMDPLRIGIWWAIWAPSLSIG